ncbi:MAG: FtsX-like permease family protein [Acidobacteria bacterium]|nr:MAG: FtsX-like permease family protein [Acidobacteriota bacterium]
MRRRPPRSGDGLVNELAERSVERHRPSYSWCFEPWEERQIVGVVGNVRTAGTDPTPLPVIYLPHRQAPVPIMNLVMRIEGDPESLAREAEATAWDMPGEINVYGTEVLSERIRSFEWTADVSALLLGAFAVLALVLGAAGIYAVVSYTVAKQTREIGLRMALGAERHTVIRMVVAHALKLALTGIALGLTGAFSLARSLGSLLYGVSVSDTATFTAAALSMLAVASIASAIPAWRASRIDPIVALRQQ